MDLYGRIRRQLISDLDQMRDCSHYRSKRILCTANSILHRFLISNAHFEMRNGAIKKFIET